jgi:hypothetical protein
MAKTTEDGFMVAVTVRVTIFSFLMVMSSALLAADVRFNKADELFKPENYREWIYIGTALTPHDKNDGKASFPEFHNVYMNRSGWKQWKKRGEFADGTVLVKELLSVGDTEAVSGKGYFQGDFSGIAVMVKDQKRFADRPGNWGFFAFGNDTQVTDKASAFDDASCAQCHVSHAKKDMVFTQYYPILGQPIKK